MKKINNYGFTLVELLVTVAILGIITGLSIPLIRNIQGSNQKRKYKVYLDSIIASSKLYVDSYEEDLFGHSDSGCAVIYYSELSKKSLLKDININGISCASDETYVRVVKLDGKYSYAAQLGCGKKDSSVNPTIIYPEGANISKTLCESSTTMDVTVTPASSDTIDVKKKKLRIKTESLTGINSNPVIYYGFRQITDSEVSEWTKLPINVETSAKQREKIEAGNAISYSTVVETPEGITGLYNLVLRVERFQDLTGANWREDLTNNIITAGTYKLDNTKPVFNDSTVVSSEANYKSLRPKLDLKVSDNYSQENDLKMCVSLDTNTCKTTGSDLKNYEQYNKAKLLSKISEKYDGSTHSVFVTVVDAALNYEVKKFTYTVGNNFTVVYNKNGGNGANMSKTICTYNEDCILRENTYTRSGYRFVGWATSANGNVSYNDKGNVKNFEASSETLNLYAVWRKEKTITVTFVYQNGAEYFSGNGGKSEVKRTCTSVEGLSCTVTTPPLNNINQTGYCSKNYMELLNIKGWSTNASATTGTIGSINVDSDATYYSIILPNSNYIRNNTRLSITGWTKKHPSVSCVGGVDDCNLIMRKDDFNVVNPQVAAREGLKYYWSGKWKYAADPTNGNNKTLFLYGHGTTSSGDKSVACFSGGSICSCPDGYGNVNQLCW